MVLALQLAGAVMAVILGFITYLQKRRGNLGNLGFTLWIAAWISLGVVTLRPSLFYPVMDRLGIPSTADFIYSSTIFASLTGLLALHTRLTRLNKRFENLVEDDAVANPLKEETNGSS
jgi:hypothetical protein